MKFIRALLIAPLLAGFFMVPAHAQKTKAQLSTEITTTYPDNTIGQITPLGVRTYESDVINSIMPTAPVVSGNLACFDGTTGLLRDCGSSPTTPPLTLGTTPVNGGATSNVLFDNGGKLGEYTVSGSGNICMTISCVMTTPALGTPSSGVGTNLTGVPISTGLTGAGTGVQAALANSLNGSGGVVGPTPTRAGDIIYWDGSIWNHLAGNNSGTQVLQENAAGTPAWATVSGTGTVTSVTCGTGLNGGTFTTSGTCSVNLSTLNNSIGANVLLNNTANFFDGPSVAQGTSGTWWASGTVTLTDSATVADFVCKLWDGTTVISAASATSESATHFASISLSGYLASPAANIKISCRDLSATTGTMLFNSTGTSKDSTISVHRVQ